MASARALLLVVAFLAGSTSRPLHPGLPASFAGVVLVPVTTSPRVGGAWQLAAPGAVAKERSPPLVVSGRTLHPAMAAAAVGVLAPPATFQPSSSKQGPDDMGLHRVVPVCNRDPPPPGLIVSIAVAGVLGLGALAVAMYYCICARKRRAAAREQRSQWVSLNDLAQV